MRKWIFVITLIPILCFGMTGNQLIENCDVLLDIMTKNGYVFFNQQGIDQSSKAGMCIGYVDAVSDYNTMFTYMHTNNAIYCPPANVTKEQNMRIVDKYLHEHPESLNVDGEILITIALKTAFPCKK